jgi:hypothetical protein
MLAEGWSLSTLGSPGGDGPQTAKVEREREKQRARPEVHGIEKQRFLVSDEVEDEPDYEPDECHGVLLWSGILSHGNAEPPRGERQLGVVGQGGGA